MERVDTNIGATPQFYEWRVCTYFQAQRLHEFGVVQKLNLSWADPVTNWAVEQFIKKAVDLIMIHNRARR